ncbi:DNA-processing protein DprA [Lederbergia sp. NSJ-179]|uniref:DNA-processing protein DprA n=1 Tax=Lederbergia sp. NSJ-179 TaxID=2931402 RepID=UPI001FD2F78A|nr:DNA-processing protein DprA [Lederbergia sp. NSJ-179]MCJ7839628.1 DNA-processing protein DprA [Lederbergia sp. NSJ-179]
MINIFRDKLFHLVHSSFLSHQSIYKLLQVDPTLTHLYTMPPTKLQKIFRFDDKKMNRFSKEFESIQPEKLFRLYQSRNIHFITILDPEYPPLLKEIHDPPFVLFLQGNSSLFHGRLLAIVGARDSDHFGKNSLRLLMPDLIQEKLTIVSGLAKGADTFAHEQAIEFGGKTIGVLGGGFFHLYPRENRKLAEFMAREHLLVSEYPPIKKPEKWHFPMRNRIIAGLSLGTLVIQAKKRSGSLITADMALDAGREVYAIPGPIHHKLSEGTNHLIQQGAKLVSSSTDILEELYFRN